MTIRDLLATRRPTLSYELFPPRTPAAEESLARTMDLLAATGPDFMSVTYGASGTTRETSRDAIHRLIEATAVPALGHLTCVGQSRAELIGVVEAYLAEGVHDFLALRGDPPRGEDSWRPHPEGLLYASELVTLIRDVAAAHGVDVSIGVTAFPAQHAVEGERELGLTVLRAKRDAGADFAITQVFYEADHYTALVEDAAAAGIDIPIIPEVMPLTTVRRAVRAQELTGVATPPALLAALESATDDDDARAIGVDFAARLSGELLDAGAPGIHIITFNQSAAALALVEAMALVRD
ncbi:methylenetetrahydrofolate reductase [Demequina pelophila]|uniref:methylenetetrahydrofolate reductase n=1 Tax=Demequina pelophila TaxID=1638984 RepID=UPI000B325DDC|nr:methylenetetrahydrofolate reductase [Demequina pelophila]